MTNRFRTACLFLAALAVTGIVAGQGGAGPGYKDARNKSPSGFMFQQEVPDQTP